MLLSGLTNLMRELRLGPSREWTRPPRDKVRILQDAVARGLREREFTFDCIERDVRAWEEWKTSGWMGMKPPIATVDELGISVMLFFVLDWKVLQLLGGEPRVAAEYMKRIAGGDLALEIAVKGNRKDSLMSSLKLMQLKLKNLISAVSGASTEVSEQSRKFETYHGAFQRCRRQPHSHRGASCQ